MFAGIGKGDIAFDANPDVAAQRSRWQTLKVACEKLQQDVLLSAENQSLVAAWERERSGVAAWQPLEIETFTSEGMASLQRLDDGSILSAGSLPEKETTSVTATMTLPRITALRLDLLPDDSLPQKGPGRAENGNLHLNEFEVRAVRPGAKEGDNLKIRRATADFDQDGWTIQHAIDGNQATAWGIHPREGSPHFAVFELETPVTPEPGMRIQVVMRQIHGRNHIIGRFRLSATDAPAEQTVALAAETQKILALPRDQRSREQQAILAAAILKQKAETELRQLPAQQKVYAAAAVAENERGVVRIESPREIRVLKRGDIEQPGRARSPRCAAPRSACCLLVLSFRNRIPNRPAGPRWPTGWPLRSIR